MQARQPAPSQGIVQTRPHSTESASPPSDRALPSNSTETTESAHSQPIDTSARAYAVWSRALDIGLGAVGLVISAPVVVVLAVLIRLDSPGPVIFRQIRVGHGGRLFVFYKFRTMWVDARERFPELYAYQYSDDEIRGMFFKVVHDPRLTRMGRHLRKTSLDELPNLINVVCGDMTLVGPRPEIPEMVRYYTPPQLEKFSVKPGLTGLAQVNGRAVLRFQETLAADMEYISRRSARFDMWILLRTVYVVFKRVGAF